MRAADAVSSTAIGGTPVSVILIGPGPFTTTRRNYLRSRPSCSRALGGREAKVPIKTDRSPWLTQ